MSHLPANDFRKSGMMKHQSIIDEKLHNAGRASMTESEKEYITFQGQQIRNI